MVAAAVAAGGALLGAGASIYSSNKAADASQAAANKAAKISQQQFEQTRSDLAPYRDQGAAAQSRYSDLIGLNGPQAQDAAYAQFRTDPGYQFALNEGLKATNYGATPGYSFNSGGRLKALQERGQGIADQQYGNYLQRYQQAGALGENAAAQTGNFGAQNAANQGNYLTQAGNAQAGAYLNAGNQIGGAISNGLQLYGYSKGYGPNSNYGGSSYLGRG